MRRFDCEDRVTLKEHVGYELDREEEAIKIIQPILMQSLK